jgi:hypothetical protein
VGRQSDDDATLFIRRRADLGIPSSPIKHPVPIL